MEVWQSEVDFSPEEMHCVSTTPTQLLQSLSTLLGASCVKTLKIRAGDLTFT